MASFWRTSSSGGILELDGVRILLDGASMPRNGYAITPPDIMGWIANLPISVAATTHSHPDHFAPAFLRRLRNAVLLGPEDVADQLPDRMVLDSDLRIRQVHITPVASLHLDITEEESPHLSYVIQGTQFCVWFLGDADPLQWPLLSDGLPRPDVLIAPYSYSLTETSWRAVEHLAPGLLILTHLPMPNQDPRNIRASCEAMLAAHPNQLSIIPVLGAQVNFQHASDGAITCSLSGRPHSSGEAGL